MGEDIKRLIEGYNLSARVLRILWRVFSNDQAAENILVTQESVDRFKVWLESGNPEDAWS